MKSIKLTPKRTTRPRRTTLMAVAAAFVALLVACAKDPPLPPLPPPTPINTAEGLRARMEVRKDHNRVVVDEDVVAWYIPCEPSPASWVAPTIVHHPPSMSSVHLNNDGSLKTSPGPRYESDEGRARLEAVLAGDALMERIVGKWTDPDRCPPGSRDM